MTTPDFNKSMIELLDTRFGDLEYPDWFAPSDKEQAWVVYESVFAAQVKRALIAGDEGFLARAFDFIEELAHSPDPEVRPLVTVAVLETIHSVTDEDRELVALARRLMGPLSRELSEDALRGMRKGHLL